MGEGRIVDSVVGVGLGAAVWVLQPRVFCTYQRWVQPREILGRFNTWVGKEKIKAQLGS